MDPAIFFVVNVFLLLFIHWNKKRSWYCFYILCCRIKIWFQLHILRFFLNNMVKRIRFHMNIPMLNRTNQLQILNLISMILIGHPIYVALIGILTFYNTKLYIHLSTQPRLPWAINTSQNLGQWKRFSFSHKIGDNFLNVSLNNFSIHMMASTSINMGVSL